MARECLFRTCVGVATCQIHRVAVIVDAVPSVVGPLEESAEEIRHLVLGPGPPAVNVVEDRAAAEGLAQRARLVAHHVAVGAAAVQAEDARGRGGAHVERFGVCVCELLLLELLMRRVACARELRDAEGVERPQNSLARQSF